MAAIASPNTTIITVPSLYDKKGQQNQQQEAFFAPGSKYLEADKSINPRLNTESQDGNSTSKSSRKKTAARKMLCARPKLSKRSAVAQKDSVTGKTFEENDPMPAMVQVEKGLANSPAAGTPIHPTTDATIDVGSKHLPRSGNEINDYAGRLDNKTEAPPELDAKNEKSVAEELSPVAETSAVVGSGTLLCQTDEAEFTTSPADKTCRQGVPVAETGTKKKKQVTQKKGFSGTTKKKSVLSEKKTSKDINTAECGKTNEEARVENEPVVCADERKACDTQLDKIEEPNEMEVGTKPVSDNDPGVNKRGKHRKLTGKKGVILLLNKSEDSVEIQREKELLTVVGEGKATVKHKGKLAAKSNLNQGSVEARKGGTIVGVDQGTTKGGKLAGKLAGKKRRGTLPLNKSEAPVEVETEDEPVQGDNEGENNVKKYARKVAAKSNMNPGPVEAEKENVPMVHNDQGTDKGAKRAGKLAGKKRRTLALSKSEGTMEVGKQNKMFLNDTEGESSGERHRAKSVGNPNSTVRKTEEKAVNAQVLNAVQHEPVRFLLSGHMLQRKEFQQLIKRLKGKLCRESHQWSFQATHLIVPDPIRRTEKFFAAAASGRWILKTDYLTASSLAGKFLPEEPYEWHNTGLSEDGAINLEAPRKWRLVREKTGHGAFYGMRIIIYGECITPPLDTLKRVVKAGDGTILATSPPYTRFLKSGVDFAIVSPGMARVDVWVQEFLRHEIPCVSADYLVEYVCKHGYSLDQHVQYNTHEWAARSFSKLLSLSEESIADVCYRDNQVSGDVACQICRSIDGEEDMLICGDENGSTGCGIVTHIDCCDPPLENVPVEDWFCPKCTEARNKYPEVPRKRHLQREGDESSIVNP